MQWQDSKDRFGNISIFLHWTSAMLVIALLVLGFWAYFLGRGPERSALLYLHVSLGLTLIPIHLVRVGWRWRYRKPVTAHDSPVLHWLAEAVWRLLILLIAIQLLTGPFLVWLHGRALSYFGIMEIAPLIGANEHLHATLARPIHLGVGILLVLTIALHLAGALKHLFIDRDGVVERMFTTGKAGGQDGSRNAELNAKTTI